MAVEEPTPTAAHAQAMAGGEVVSIKSTPAAAFARARELFLAGAKLDMGALAAELGVARATLYRWTGDRERLLGDVAWVEVEALLQHIARTTPGDGARYLERAAGAFLDLISDNPTLRAFLAAEGEFGLRVITAPNGRMRPRMVALVRDIIVAQVEQGAYQAPADPAVLADGIVSLGERFLYHRGDPAMNPDPATARQTIALLLREPCPPPAP